jgi:ABC-type lipoprotein export system ATPase subunit
MERLWEMDEPLVALDKVSRYYRRGAVELAALEDVTCQIEINARVAVVGPSGSGKSTLLHLIAGLDSPSRGIVNWPGLGSQTELRPDQISLVFQMPSLLPTLSVLENVELCWLLSKRSEVDARPAALQILEKLGLSSVLSKLPAELSGGQMQRVAAARALVCQPRLILADEPTGQLDRATANRLVDVLIESAADYGAALIVATHDFEVADRLETQWRMAHGKLE